MVLPNQSNGWKNFANSKSLSVRLVLLVAMGGSASASSSGPTNSMEYLLRQDCGSCHGMTLKGGLGPALTMDTLRGKPDDYLKAVIEHGIPGTAMPPWRELLSEDQVDELIRLMRRNTPTSTVGEPATRS